MNLFEPHSIIAEPLVLLNLNPTFPVSIIYSRKPGARGTGVLILNLTSYPKFSFWMSEVTPHSVAIPPNMAVTEEVLEAVKRVLREVSAVQTERPDNVLVVVTGVLKDFIVQVWAPPETPVQ